MGNWAIWSSYGILKNLGEFNSEEECEDKCKELREENKLVNVFYIPRFTETE
ncbi:hypothetical protein AWH56_008695 [Anaerobacillus isosaccharinicus]|uniref:SPOR domain-containing protein n=1 Tax=Anaerobacillus isosaccharinicus TaxID=1532552 RepID=A0A7S7RD45_9BACI|nr:hypothetical protein [Anaerobacillus isosaccharinicus]MBA5588949.1 hypothetical protein [Anaerobacillus isosaccharinicus]QOY37642.1 hypothetical protein AWH56_008695 [Anaerobacillus isosaccharinicus]